LLASCFKLDWFIGLEHVCVARSRKLFLLKFNLRDDDDEFLYGDSQLKLSTDIAVATPAVPSSAGENTSSLLLALVSSCDAFCILLVLKRNINSIFWLTFSFPCVRVSLRLSVNVT
jgi:hypothetical protein